MRRTIERVVMLAPKGRDAVEGREIVSAIREGRLTKGQFDAWHAQRRNPHKGIVIAMHDSPPSSARRSMRRHKSR
jgi:hypothetical protein